MPIASSDARPAHVGARAIATLMPVGASSDDAGRPPSGLATFNQTEAGVDLTIAMKGCVFGDEYPIVIQAGTDCDAATLGGGSWDRARGQGIPAASCTGTSGVGRSTYSRMNSDATPWSIGAPVASDILGHALVLFDAKTLQPVACGVITVTDDSPEAPPVADGAQPSAVIRAQIAGLCLAKMLVRDNQQECPDPEALAQCASDHCSLDACVAHCADYAQCLAQQSDPCSVLVPCTRSSECDQCRLQVTMCTIDFCGDEIACAAPPAPDGPCAKLEACCAMQGDGERMCLSIVHALEKLSGDPSCYGVMHDWQTTTTLAVPCKFE